MRQRIKEAIIASFVADALSLGVHWVYNTSDIEKKYGRLEKMVKPELAPYHKSRQKGEFTHYGDQMMVLLESVKEMSGFDLSRFCGSWQKMFHSYKGYVDHATTETMENLNSGIPPTKSGALSMDLGGAARIAPLALYYGQDPEGFVAAARAQTAMTHNTSGVMACAELFARTSVKVLKGEKPVEGLQKSLDEMSDIFEIQPLVKAGLNSRSEDTRETIVKFGQECAFQAALPSTVHLIAKYEDNLKEALIENCMAGGDSSARGILAGFILGCSQGIEKIPEQWLDDMPDYKKIIRIME